MITEILTFKQVFPNWDHIIAISITVQCQFDGNLKCENYEFTVKPVLEAAL